MSKELLDTTDGNAWAQRFIETVDDGQVDVDLMRTWFANAIETGRSHGHTINKTLADMQQEVYENNIAHGWFDDKRTFGDGIALLHSEVSEALEEYREHGVGAYRKVADLAHGTTKVIPITNGEYGDGKPLGVPSEYADILIRLLDSCHREGVDLMAEYEAKMAYNRTRPIKHGNKVM